MSPFVVQEIKSQVWNATRINDNKFFYFWVNSPLSDSDND